ncbi:flagellar hook-length control protein FliK [Spongiibacter marinus]|uniref:flagellar hook-length control protein FliK n=1 Tax=Spongiibacter marinus TaxID=354246 RepID=UPI00356A9FFE
MVIINPTHNTQPAALLRPAGPAPVLAPDRVMNAVVLGERAQHLYELASGSLRMMAESQTPLRKGEQLQLQVVGRDAQQRPELRIMQRGDVNIAPILRDRLPQQQGLNQLMATLSQLNQQLSPSVQKLLAPVLASIPHRKQLNDGERVKTALQNSGQFFEAKLLKNAPRNLDFKAALLKLAAQLDQQAAAPPKAPLAKNYPLPTAAIVGKATGDAASPQPGANIAPKAAPSSPLSAPSAPKPRNEGDRAYQGTLSASKTADLPGQLSPQPRTPPSAANQQEVTQQGLLRAVRGALARLDVQQLVQLQTGREASGVVELPIKDHDGIDIWQFQFQPPRQRDAGETPQHSHASREDNQQRGWALNLCFDLPGLGAMKVTLAEVNQQLEIRFTASNAETLALLNRHQHVLREQLQNQEVPIADIVCQCGNPSASGSRSFVSSLLDDHA